MNEMMMLTFLLSLYLTFFQVAYSASKDKPHGHTGILTAYDGKHIPYTLSEEQTKKLDSGEAVIINERTGKSGRGVCLQDIEAPPQVCMDRIKDLPNYKTMVPKVKSIDIYSEEKFSNGTIQTGAKFNVGISLLTFTYFLLLTYEPAYNTYTWTLDYRHSSDFDDNTGHWQVMDHPTKPGWTRVLYSTEVRLFSWIPEFVVTFLTKTALVESTTWVRRESEKAAKQTRAADGYVPSTHLTPCFVTNEDGSSRYDTKCSELIPSSSTSSDGKEEL